MKLDDFGDDARLMLHLDFEDASIYIYIRSNFSVSVDAPVFEPNSARTFGVQPLSLVIK